MAPVPPPPRAGCRRPVRTAVLVSLAVHAVVAMFLLTRRTPVPVPRADSGEVDFQVLETPAQPEESQSMGQTGEGEKPVASLPEAKRPGARHRGSRGVRHAERGDGKSGGETADKASEEPAAGAGTADRFATFGPGRPDLSKVPGLQAPGGKRDLLAAPRAKEKAPTELPREIRGPGGVTAQVDEDGRIHFRDPSASLSGPSERNTGVSVTLDLNDYLMRMAGMDPYSATKRKMAEETHEQRLCMARRAQHVRESQALFDLSTKVRAIVSRKDWSPEKRRRVIFDVWDECDDVDSDYGAMARATIAAIIRQAFPAGSSLAYSPQELLALNGRRNSRLEFAPYVARESKRSVPRLDDCPSPDAPRSAE